MKRLKLISALSAITVSLTLLAGCSSGKIESTDKSSDQVLKDGKMTELTVILPGGNSAPANLEKVEEAINNTIKDKMDATVKFKILEWGVYADQTKLMLSSGEDADLMFTFSNTIIPANSGQIQPISQYIDKYAPDTKELLEKYLDACKVNGDLYGLPTLHEYTSKTGLVARQDVIDQLGIDVSKIKTWQDIENVIDKVHQTNPKMNVLINAEQQKGPLQYYNNGVFDIVDTNSGVGVYAKANNDGKIQVINTYDSKEFMNMAKVAYDWNKKGYFIPDATTNNASRQDIIRAGNAFGYIGTIQPGTVTQETKNSGVKMVAIPISEGITATSNVNFAQYMVPTACKNPSKAVAFLNMLYTNKDVQNLFLYGVEGNDYIIKDKTNDVAGYPEGKNSKNAGWSNETWLTGNAFIAHVWETDPVSIWSDYKKLNDSATMSPLYGFVYDPSNVKNEMSALKNVITKYEAVIESGYADPVTSVEKFNSELKSAGIQNVIDDMQKQVDKWLANKK